MYKIASLYHFKFVVGQRTPVLLINIDGVDNRSRQVKKSVKKSNMRPSNRATEKFITVDL